MKRVQSLRNLSALLLLAFLSSCTAIEGIFKAGIWTGIILVVVIVAIVILILANIFKK